MCGEVKSRDDYATALHIRILNLGFGGGEGNDLIRFSYKYL